MFLAPLLATINICYIKYITRKIIIQQRKCRARELFGSQIPVTT